MLTKDDLIDIVLERLGSPAAGREAGAVKPAADKPDLGREIRGRLFLSDYDIRKRLTPNSLELRIPENAIISPLALDWLALRRFKIVRE
ncbi:MAG TPA: hypothetical protein DEB40_13880 [Elusimicrobia bacterium]|nr:hypothetical protein [Elusimicrobiota bacterium]HBT62823.1 hypothetical protein [Elusimicrobiota bacterium]